MAHRRIRHLLLPSLIAFAAGYVIAKSNRRMPVGNTDVPEPAKPVDLDRYLGCWYEIGRYENGFERDCEGVTADYSIRPDGLIRVLNTGHRGRPTGRARLAEGKARVVEASGNAKLKVSFFGPFFFGNYWVLDHDDDYQWSIVGEPTGRYLWILSRHPTMAEDLKAMLFERVSKMGYDTGLIRMTLQPHQGSNPNRQLT
jgi:apolipoprotein D and lipocalin family protein